MTQKTDRIIRLVYGILLSAVIVVAGICLIGACLGIYISGGEQIYTPEKVAQAFSGIAIPVYLCLALMIGGFILDTFLPREKGRLTPEKQYTVILSKLHSKLDLPGCDEALRSAVLAQQKKRRLYRYVGYILLGSGSIVFLIYTLNPSNIYRESINDVMIAAMAVMLPCLAVPFAWAVFSAYAAKASMRKEIALVKQAIAQGCQTEVTQPAPPAGKNLLPMCRWALLAVGVAVLIYGFFAGGTADVLTKAINICTECVGLG